MGNERKLTASCIVMKDNSVLLVKHTYGAAKGKYLIPGGFSEEHEMPQQTAEREVFEETQVYVKAKELIAVRFTKKEVWCIFYGEYQKGEPTSDKYENEDAIFMPIDEAINNLCVVETTREILKAFIGTDKSVLKKSQYVNPSSDEGSWQLFI